MTASQETHAAPIDVSQRTCKGYLQANDLAGPAARQLGYLCRNNPDAFVIEIHRRALADNSGNP